MSFSALMGTPPANEDDYYIVKWFLSFYAEFAPSAVQGLKPEDGFSPVPKPIPNVHSDLSQQIIIFGWFVVAFITLMTLARVTLPFFVKDIKWGWDDTVYMLAFFVGQATNVAVILNAWLGKAGSHTWEYTYHNLYETLRWSQLSQWLYYVALGLIKISLALFVRRAVGNSSKAWKICVDILLAICVMYTIAVILVQPLVLRPWSSNFNIIKAGREGVVIDYSPFDMVVLSHNITNAVLDFILVWIPFFFFFKLNVNKSKKIRLMLLYVVGLLTVATAVARVKVAEVIKVEPDQFYYSGVMGLIGLVETLLSFIVANSATLNTTCILGTRKVLSSRNRSSDLESKATSEPRQQPDENQHRSIHDHRMRGNTPAAVATYGQGSRGSRDRWSTEDGGNSFADLRKASTESHEQHSNFQRQSNDSKRTASDRNAM